MKGKLYIVSTPIGNLEDVTFRAIRILNECDYLLAESSERSSKILQKYNISKKIVTFNKDNEKNKVSKILNDLSKGSEIALVSDAGTPSISDPAFELIKLCDYKFAVIPIPGPSSLTCALSISRIPINNFSFHGFLPKKKSGLIDSLKNIKATNLPAVIFESKTRLLQLLSTMSEILGKDVKINVFRELTKIHEEVINMSIGDTIEFYNNKKLNGEFTIIVDKCNESNDHAYAHGESIKILLEKFSPSETATVVSKFTGINRKDVYKYILSIRQEP